MTKFTFVKISILYLLLLYFTIASTVLAKNGVRFIENKGQWHSNVLYKANVKGGLLYLEKNKLTFDLIDIKTYNQHIHAHYDKSSLHTHTPTINKHAYNVEFVNSQINSELTGKYKTPEYYNYFLGNDKSKWAGNVNSYHQINYNNVYEGIDFNIYSKENLKYDIIVRPNANTEKIQLKYNGVDGVTLQNGQLIIETSVNKIIEEKPYAYQIINGKEIQVICNYKLENNIVGFEFPNGYDKNLDLIIDPTLIFSAFSGSFSDNFGYTATFDSKGFLYSGSSAFGNNYPTTVGAYNTNFNNGTVDIAISKFDTTGTFLIYSTYIGGNNNELPHSLIVNSFDELFILGTTSSTNYPTTPLAYDTTFNGGSSNPLPSLGVTYTNGSDIIISNLSADGSTLISSTYVGGSENDGLNSTSTNPILNILRYNYADEIRGEIDIDRNNNIFVISSTQSDDFPIVGNVFQPNYGGGAIDACIIKMDNSLQNIIWSSYLGGEKHDAGYSLAIDSIDNVYVTGGTESEQFPTTPNSLTTDFEGGRSDGFVSHISKDGQSLISSTYYGSSAYDQSYFVETDRQNNVYLLGQTEITDNTFIENVGFSNPGSGQFISKITPQLDSLIYSTVFGAGNGINISPTAFLVDLCNKIYLTGWGGNVNNSPQLNNNAGNTLGMPITIDAQQPTTDGSDFYIMVLQDDGSSLAYGSYFGGAISDEHVDGGTSRFDRKGKIYQAVCAGCGGNSDFPIAPPGNPLNTNNSPNCNLGVFKLDLDFPFIVADFDVPPVACAPLNYTFTNTSLIQIGTSYSWDFGDGNTSNQFTPSHTYSTPGTYLVKLVLNDPSSCNISDSIEKEIIVLGNISYDLNDVTICLGETEQIGILPNSDPSLTYNWSPAAGLSDVTISNPFASPNNTTNYSLLISNGLCTDTVNQTVVVNAISLETTNDTTICFEQSLNLVANSLGTGNTFIWSSTNNFTDTLNPSLTDSMLTVSPTDTSTYYVMVSNNNCSLTNSITVNVDPFTALTSSISSDKNPILEGESTQLTVSPSGFNYSWSPIEGLSNPNIENPVASPSTTTNYSVTIFNNNGCSLTSTILVEVINCGEPNIFVPNAFTPNKDGENDILFVRGDNISEIDFKIYNRWGEKVFETDQQQIGWDGNFKGKPVDPGVFVYYLTIRCFGEQEFFKKGNISVIR